MTSDALRGVQSAVEVFRVLSVSLDLDQTLNAVLDGLKQTPVPDKFRLLIREYEYVSANYMRILTHREHENYCDREHLT